MLSERERESVRANAIDQLLEWHLRHRGTPGGTADLLDMVGAAVADAQAAETSLQNWVVAARRSGATWAQIGDEIGSSRQAAQQRFGDLVPPNPSPVASRDVEVVEPVTLAEEVAVLAQRGRDGYMVTDVGAQQMVFMKTATPIEHRRVPMLAHGPTADEYRADGWEIAVRAFPFLYLARSVTP